MILNDEQLRDWDGTRPIIDLFDTITDLKRQLADRDKIWSYALFGDPEFTCTPEEADKKWSEHTQAILDDAQERVDAARAKFDVHDMLSALAYASEGRANSVKPDLLANWINKAIANRSKLASKNKETTK